MSVKMDNSRCRLIYQVDRGRGNGNDHFRKGENFYWKRLICRFGTLMAIISDNGQQFDSKYTTEFCQSMGIQNRFASVEHPQKNFQVESANKVGIMGMKRRL